MGRPHLHGVDERTGLVYFSGTERSHIGGDVYRIKLDGSGLTRLSQTSGTHAANFSPGFAHYVDTWSDLNTPPQVRVHRADGHEVRLVHESRIAGLAAVRMVTPEFLQVKTRDGFVMEAMLIKPPGFDRRGGSRCMQFTYGGPHAPRVAQPWGGVDQYVSTSCSRISGIIVWICDNRSASGKGAESAWTCYKQLGVQELADIEDGLGWLSKQPYVDARASASTAGATAASWPTYALTHSKSFAMGIAGGNGNRLARSTTRSTPSG